MDSTFTNTQIYVSESLRQFAQDHSPALLFGELEYEQKAFKYSHITNVVHIGMQFNTPDINRELLHICLQLHDIGRKKQFDLIGNFDDNLLDHHILAIQMINEWFKIYPERLPNEFSADWQIMVDCCLYHGNIDLSCLAHSWSIPYLRIVRAADQIENGCIGAPRYLEKEKACDMKGYIATDPMRDQTECNPLLLQYMAKGYVFSKASLCHTYAEYFIYAITLAIHVYMQYPDIARECMKEYHTIDKYCEILTRHLNPHDATQAIDILHKIVT